LTGFAPLRTAPAGMLMMAPLSRTSSDPGSPGNISKGHSSLRALQQAEVRHRSGLSRSSVLEGLPKERAGKKTWGGADSPLAAVFVRGSESADAASVGGMVEEPGINSIGTHFLTARSHSKHRYFKHPRHFHVLLLF
jgi:hypothetical protein